MWELRARRTDPARPVSFRLMPGAVKTIGRARAADFCLDVPFVSRLHCRVEVGPDGAVEVVDLGSTNGTWVDGKRVSRATLARGSVLRVGRVEFALEPCG
ncbi:MAG TPA: FHA domain-containing protein [Vicinamibacterales bacterium]|nr:FHA domain-containing protein [Vicinamibacterales bacterium]HOG27795.1 FHA domain-containing protein [Vicinamibacterales bacterium]HPK70467.1 FHA domain-containing protein [Vicinamibacterales bacterium]HPW19238.1 FHA domain-containing protein [Vicinamibacterales bacterium]